MASKRAPTRKMRSGLSRNSAPSSPRLLFFEYEYKEYRNAESDRKPSNVMLPFGATWYAEKRCNNEAMVMGYVSTCVATAKLNSVFMGGKSRV